MKSERDRMNPLNLPKQDEVQEFSVGKHDIKLVEITEENRKSLADIAMLAYLNEPCRICGVPIAEEDLPSIVWAGVSDCRRSRSAHKECWDANKPQREWAYPVTAGE